MLFNEKITLYNNIDGESWKRTVLDRVMVNRSYDRVMDSDGVIHTKPVVKVTVPYRKGYTSPKNFTGEGFTFGVDNLDIIALGVLTEQITASNTITQVKRNNPDVWTIKGVEDNSKRTFLPHWVIVCEA